MNIWIVLPISAMVIFTSSDQINWNIVKRYRGWYGKKVWKYIDYTTESTVVDRALCEWKCFNHNSCYSVTFGNEDFSCKLDTIGTYFVYTDDAEYDLSVMKRFTVRYDRTSPRHILNASVFVVIDETISDVALSNWTVDAARGLCGKLDSQLKTYNELNDTRSDYYSEYCGYVEGGTAVTFVPSVNNTFTLSNCSLIQACAFCGDTS